MDKYLKFNYYKSLSLQVKEEAYDKTKKWKSMISYI